MKQTTSFCNGHEDHHSYQEKYRVEIHIPDQRFDGIFEHKKEGGAPSEHGDDRSVVFFQNDEEVYYYKDQK
jgi:hypothetical protein